MPLLRVERPDFAAVTGAAAFPPPPEPSDKTRSGWSALAAVGAALAMVLAPMLLYTALIAVPDQPLNEYGMSVYFNYGMYGLGCGLVGTAALSVALLAATALPASTISGLLGLPTNLATRRLPALIVAGSAVPALALVWLYRLVTTAFLEPDPPGLAAWTMLPILPTCLAGVMLGCAILARPDRTSLDRLGRLAFPVLPLTLAAIGALTYEHARHIPLQTKMHWMLYLALRCGAALIAFSAIVLLLAGLRPVVIAIVAVPVAGLTAAVVNIDGLGPVVASYLGAAAWWWLSRAASTSVAILRPLAAGSRSTLPPATGAPFVQPLSPAGVGGHRAARPHGA